MAAPRPAASGGAERGGGTACHFPFPSLPRAAIRLRVRAEAATPQHRPRCRHAPGLRARPSAAVSTDRLHPPAAPRVSQPLSRAVSGQFPRLYSLKGVTAPRHPSGAPGAGTVLVLRGGSGAPAARPALSRRCWRSSGRAAAPAEGRGRSTGSSRVSESRKICIAGGRAAPAPRPRVWRGRGRVGLGT